MATINKTFKCGHTVEVNDLIEMFPPETESGEWDCPTCEVIADYTQRYELVIAEMRQSYKAGQPQTAEAQHQAFLGESARLRGELSNPADVLRFDRAAAQAGLKLLAI